jgi:hypothetical protein
MPCKRTFALAFSMSAFVPNPDIDQLDLCPSFIKPA